MAGEPGSHVGSVGLRGTLQDTCVVVCCGRGVSGYKKTKSGGVNWGEGGGGGGGRNSLFAETGRKWGGGEGTLFVKSG